MNRFYISATKAIRESLFSVAISASEAQWIKPLSSIFQEKINLKFTLFSRLSTKLKRFFFTQFQIRVNFSLSKIIHNNEVIIATIIFKVNLIILSVSFPKYEHFYYSDIRTSF